MKKRPNMAIAVNRRNISFIMPYKKPAQKIVRAFRLLNKSDLEFFDHFTTIYRFTFKTKPLNTVVQHAKTLFF